MRSRNSQQVCVYNTWRAGRVGEGPWLQSLCKSNPSFWGDLLNPGWFAKDLLKSSFLRKSTSVRCYKTALTTS